MPESKRDVFEYTSPPVGYRLKPVPHIDHPPQGGHVETVTYLSTRRMATLPGPRGRAVRATRTLKSCRIDGACSPHPASVEHCPGDRRYQLFVGLLGLPLHGPGRRRTRKSADIREFGHSQPPECPQCLVLFEYVYHPTGDRLKLVPHTDRRPQVATYKTVTKGPNAHSGRCRALADALHASPEPQIRAGTAVGAPPHLPATSTARKTDAAKMLSVPWRSWHLESTHATTAGAHVREGGDVERSCASEGQGCSGRAVCKRVCRGRWISPSWQRAAAFAALPQLCCEHGDTIMRARRRACASQPGRCWRASAAALDE